MDPLCNFENATGSPPQLLHLFLVLFWQSLEVVMELCEILHGLIGSQLERIIFAPQLLNKISDF